jgi:hypothetical protein
MVEIRRIVPSDFHHWLLILWADSPDRMGCFRRDRTIRLSGGVTSGYFH